MSLDTSIRFLEPVDPRMVWAIMRTMIEAPADSAWDRYAPNPDMTALFAPNPTWYAPGGQGAGAVAFMSYGAEGALLDDREYHDPQDDWGPGQIPPPAYVEITLTNGNKDRHGEFAHQIICAIGLRTAVSCNDGGWITMPVNPSPAVLSRALRLDVKL
jgi:hypothetical protein